MTAEPRMVLAALLFFAAVIIRLWGSEILGGTGGGWERGRAQAGSERRRAAAALGQARHGGGAGQGGQGNGAGRHRPRFAAAAGALRAGMRGPRQGSVPGSGVAPGGGPGRRIIRAAGAGAVAGARLAGAAHRAAVRAGRAGRAGLAGRGSGPGRAAGPGRARRWRGRRDRNRAGRVRIGTCDSCGAWIAAAALAWTPVTHPWGTEHWVLCPACRMSVGPQETRPATPAGQVGSSPAAPQLGAGAAPSAAPGQLQPGGDPEPAGTGAWPPGIEWTTGPAEPAEPAGTGGWTYTARPEEPAEPAGAPALAGTRPGLTGGPEPAGEPPAEAIPGTAADPGDTPVLAGVNAGPAPMTGEPAMHRQLATVGAGGVAGRRAAGTQVDVRDTTNHGEWMTHAKQVVGALDYIKRCIQAMTSSLTTAEASEDQIRDVERWVGELTRVRNSILRRVAEIDGRLDEYIKAIEDAGGPAQVGSPGYHSDY